MKLPLMPTIANRCFKKELLDKKIFLIITVDYELPNSNHVDVRRYMINPIYTLLDEFNSIGAKLTIMVEMAELLAMEKDENKGFIKFLGYSAPEEIRSQLKQVISLGHDVQLHVHPQWQNARWLNKGWVVDFSNYRLPDLEYNNMVNLLSICRKDLEKTLTPVCGDYTCVGIRAGHWNTQPSPKYIDALMEVGLISDSSVFKWGFRNNNFARFDYSDALVIFFHGMHLEKILHHHQIKKLY